MMQNIEKELMNFIDQTPNAYFCVNNLKNILIQNGYEELYENEEWNNLKQNGKYFVIRNDSSIIAFKMCNQNPKGGFHIVSAHADSPMFTIKPNPEIFDNMYLKLNINGYGGMINYTWLDRPLSLAGRVVTLTNGIYETKLVNIPEDLLVIPSQAIHINREANTKLELNPQTDMLPVLSLSNEKNLETILREHLESQGIYIDQICDYDLNLYTRDTAKIVGLNHEFILAPRLDDLSSVFPAVNAFMESDNQSSVPVFCVFNNEEIGSLSLQGANSPFLMNILSRISTAFHIPTMVALRNSIAISADNAHAVHPNAPLKSDPTNKILLNKGVVIKHHINYTTDALSSTLFKAICKKAKVPYQDFACRADMKCGSTLGKISQSQVDVHSLDIGLPQLAMHSAVETIGTNDILYLYQSLLAFYNTTFFIEKNQIQLS